MVHGRASYSWRIATAALSFDTGSTRMTGWRWRISRNNIGLLIAPREAMRYSILLVLIALPGLAGNPRHFETSGPAVSGSAALSLYAYGLAPTAMATDPAGNVYVTGSTQSNVFFATSGAVQPAYGGGTCIPFTIGPSISRPQPCSDAFVVKLNPAGDIVYATYLGGNGDDRALAIAADAEGNAYVA